MDGQSVDAPSYNTLSDYLDDLCVYYMSMGVPYDVFWYGDYCCLKYYEEVYLKKRKIRNEEMWMMGMYNYTAHATTLGNAFRGRGQQAHDYLKEPIQFFPKTEKEEELEAQRTRQHVIDNLNRIKREWDRTHVSRNSKSRDKDS